MVIHIGESGSYNVTSGKSVRDSVKPNSEFVFVAPVRDAYSKRGGTLLLSRATTGFRGSGS